MIVDGLRCHPEHLEEALEASRQAMLNTSERDWSRPAGDVSWSCAQVLTHITANFVTYATQLAAGATQELIPLVVQTRQDASRAVALQVMDGSGKVLSATLRTAPAGALAWHPFGLADAEATPAMGIVELLVHTHDICSGLGQRWRGPDVPAAAALVRVFPETRALLAEHEPWDVLLWATGRTELRSAPRRGAWRWRNDRSEHAPR